MSLRDLTYLMLTISDNAAADAVLAAVGISSVNNRLRAIGCRETVVVESLQATLDGVASDMGHRTYLELVARKTVRWDQRHRRWLPTQSGSTDVEHSIPCRHRGLPRGMRPDCSLPCALTLPPVRERALCFAE